MVVVPTPDEDLPIHPDIVCCSRRSSLASAAMSVSPPQLGLQALHLFPPVIDERANPAVGGGVATESSSSDATVPCPGRKGSALVAA